jgi:putative ABC transport system substrate-binding protein
MLRRAFIAWLSNAAAWPLAVQAQPAERVRRIGVLLAHDENDPEGKVRISAFKQGLTKLGWIEGRNLRMDVRWAAGNVDQLRIFAKELVGLQPDILLASATAATAALQRETGTIPMVFVNVSDPIGSGFVASLARPGANMTGFSNFEASIAGRWLGLLTQIAPGIKRVAVMFNPDLSPGGGSFFVPPFKAAARLLKVEPITAPVHSDAEIEATVTSLGREPRGGLVVLNDGFMTVHRGPIMPLAARNNVPAVYGQSFYAREGGLLSYGPDQVDFFRRGALYVDRILRGEKPANLPVQLPVKFETAINITAAKVLGLTIPETLLATADEVIQ